VLFGFALPSDLAFSSGFDFVLDLVVVSSAMATEATENTSPKQNRDIHFIMFPF
jgi:hypothetical protein